MIYQTKYANAYSEVYEILKYLDRDEYLKIPTELLDVIENNRNIEYEYNLDKSKSLYQQNMLEETKAILLNIFRDYLADSIQKSKIQQWQQEDRNARNMKLHQKYTSNIFQNNKQNNQNKIEKENFNSHNLLVKLTKESLIKKIVNKIKKILKLK